LGLGHATRGLAIASHLTQRYPDCSVLLVTDLPIIGRFHFPPNVDYVRLPGIGQGGDSGRAATSLDVSSALKIRRKILQGVIKTFRPQILILERDPSSLALEVQRVLTFLREEIPEAKAVWALPDIVGEPQGVIDSWTRASVYSALDELCDEVWVHGDRSLFDQARHYRLPGPVAAKVVYTGYLRSPRVGTERVRRKVSRQPRCPTVLVTAGGGAAGYPLVDGFLDFLEARRGRVPFHSVIVTGPMMRSEDKGRLKARAARLSGLTFHRFSRHLLEYMSCADLVVSNGGYNTHCAALSYGKRALVAPGMRPPNERLLRGRVFERLGITQVLDPEQMTPERLGELVTAAVLGGRAPVGNGGARVIPMDGLERMGARIEALVGEPQSRAKAAPYR
jgi:predicted glycosyltransferase